MIEEIKNIGVILGVALSSMTFLGIIVKPIRSRFISWIRDTSRVENTDKLIIELKDSFDKFSVEIKEDILELKDDFALSKEANRCVCGNRIINAFHKYKDSGEIPSYEVDSLIEHHDVYVKLGGNGKVEKKYQELMEKHIGS